MHHKNSVRINVYLAKYFRYRKSSYSTTRIRVNELSNLNKNTQNLSILVRYANFYVKSLRKSNDKITQFHWSRKSRDSCPTSSGCGSGSRARVIFLWLKTLFQPAVTIYFNLDYLFFYYAYKNRLFP